MRRKVFLLLGLVLFLYGTPVLAQNNAKPGSDGIDDPYFPQLGNGGYLVDHYMLDLNTDVDAFTMTATVTIDATATQDLSAFNLDFSGFEISSVTVDSSHATYTRSGHELTVTPAKPIVNGTAFSTVVTYGGDIKAFSRKTFPTSLGWNKIEDGIYVINEPDGAASWYPVNDHPLDKATYTIKITVPKPYVAASNGLLKGTTENGTTTTYLWEVSDQMASYLVTIDIAEFTMKEATGPDDIPILNFFPADTSTAKQAHILEVESKLLSFYSEKFGPYPLESSGAIIFPAKFEWSLETQDRPIYGLTVFTNDGLMAHEMAHMWFGDSVSLKTWKDIWLNEGFATYASLLWLEAIQGSKALEARITDAYRQIPLPMAGTTVAAPNKDMLFNEQVYTRGALTLHALRLKVGDAVFFNILRTYVQKYRHDNASTEDFISVAESVSGKSLKGFFDAWLSSSALPDIPEMGLSRES